MLCQMVLLYIYLLYYISLFQFSSMYSYWYGCSFVFFIILFFSIINILITLFFFSATTWRVVLINCPSCGIFFPISLLLSLASLAWCYSCVNCKIYVIFLNYIWYNTLPFCSLIFGFVHDLKCSFHGLQSWSFYFYKFV